MKNINLKKKYRVIIIPTDDSCLGMCPEHYSERYRKRYQRRKHAGCKRPASRYDERHHHRHQRSISDERSLNAKLTFSFIGYVTQTVQVAGKTTLDIILKEDAQALDEVIVVGYGTMKKSDIAGSVASVNAEDMLRRTPTNIAQGLQGAAPGVIVTMQDGAPDANAAVRIRGVATINGKADPLYVVDGIQVGTNANFINPSDIESIEVLKDASATAIYGSAGANGVVI